MHAHACYPLMSRAALIFPHQLYKEILFKSDTIIYLVEDNLFFSQYNFHQQKLVLHRASLKFYESYLKQAGYKTVYIEYGYHKGTKEVIEQISKTYTELSYIDTTDYLLERRIERYAKRYKLEAQKLPSLTFCSNLTNSNNRLEKVKSILWLHSIHSNVKNLSY